MLNISVRIDDAKTREAFRKGPELMRRIIGQGVERGAHEVAREAKARAPKAFSTLANSIKANRIDDLHWRAAPATNYADAVEEGRKPGKQTGTANGLMEWVKLKTGLKGRKLDRATFAIARAIGRRGIRPQPFMRPTAKAKKSRVIELIRQAVERGCAELSR